MTFNIGQAVDLPDWIRGWWMKDLDGRHLYKMYIDPVTHAHYIWNEGIWRYAGTQYHWDREYLKQGALMACLR